ncbi:MAG: heavy-metal-associated domain-containing protein [Muribaculaceae bacterium]|nr:heavy-metal-associated domain-containing protein [Muribaculaceae bacterium]
MKKYLLLFLLASVAILANAKDIREYVVTTVPQMSCQNCENRIKGNLRFEKGVKKIETDLKNQKVTVTYDADKTDEKKLEEAFGKLNYKVIKIDDCDDSAGCGNEKAGCASHAAKCSEKNGNCCSTKEVSEKKKN